MATLYNEDVHSEAAKVRANNPLPRVQGDRYLSRPKRVLMPKNMSQMKKPNKMDTASIGEILVVYKKGILIYI